MTIEINPNPVRMGHYKRECHKLINQIWGSDRKNMAEAYKWINKNFGDIHFSTCNDEDVLRNVFNEMWKLSFKIE